MINKDKNPEELKKDSKGVGRRDFLKTSAAVVGTATAASMISSKLKAQQPTSQEDYELTYSSNQTKGDILAQCPYCGVGCGCIIKTNEKGKIVGVIPDKDHPTNKGLQCIKGLASAEAIYVDRLTKPLIRKDMSDPTNGYVSKTKGSFDPSLFREASWEEAEEIIADKIVDIINDKGGNAVGLYGSG